MSDETKPGPRRLTKAQRAAISEAVHMWIGLLCIDMDATINDADWQVLDKELRHVDLRRGEYRRP